MDCGGPPLKQQQDFGIQDLWTPTTPAKIIQTKRTFVSNPGYIQWNQPSGPIWLDQVLAVSGGVQTATSPWGLTFQNGICSSTGYGDCLRDLSGSLAVAHPSASQATIGSSFTPHAANASYGNAGSMNCWSPKLSENVIAAGNATRICPTQLPHNGKILLPGDFCSSSSSKSNWPGQKDQYGSTMTCLPKQNSFPETMMSFAGAVSMPNLQTPTITEKYSKRMDDKQPYLEVIDLVDEDTREENLLRKEASLLQLAFEKPAEISFSNLITSSQYTSFQNPQCVNDMVFLSDKLSDQLAGIEKSPTEIENEGADLNDASKQKPKRKKHRPKVIIEGKPARTPKPATPKLKTPKPAGDTENVSGKRKYTRRKKETTPSSEANTLGEIADAESRSGAKSVRRCLNFDLEDSRTIDDYSVFTSLFMQDLENHVQKVCENGTLTNSRLKETVDSAGVQVPMVENSLTRILFDLNGSNSQPQNEYLKILQTPVPSITVSHNVGASENIVNSNTISNAPHKGTKRDHCLIDEAWMLNNLMHSYNSGDCASKSLDAGRQGSCPDIYKRMRMEKVHNHAISDPYPKLIYTPSTGWKTIHTSNNSQEFIYADGPKFKAQEKLQTLEGMLSSEETYVNVYNQHILGNNPTLSGFMGCNRNSTPIKPSIQKNNGMSQPSTPGNPSGYSNSQECKIHATMVQPETCEGVNNPVKAKGRRGRKKKEQYPPVNPVTLSIGIGASLGQNNPGVATATSIHNHGEDSHPKVNSVGCQDSSHHKAATHSTFSLEPLASYMDSLDDIVMKLRWLNISRDHEVYSSQAHNAIVPYVRDGAAMIPYEGTFDPIKKRRPRAKVDLDPETNRVWKLLMGKEGERDEGANVDKEKWWEEERRVFRGRVDSFIARMHLVQGDRRFSQWKGSVVDSVIGVFLTQNVSDHLSSSAFMALAAKFPLRSNDKYRCSNAEKVSMQSLTDLPKLQRNILDHGSCSQNSLEVNAANNDGKKDNSCSNETLGSGTGSSSVDFCKGNPLELHETEVYFEHESPNSGSGTAATVTSINSVQLEDRRLMDEAVSSQNSLVSSQNSVAHQAESNDHSLLNIDAEDLLIGSMNNGFECSFTELMQMAERNRFQELCSYGSGRIWTVESSSLNSQVTREIGNSVPSLNKLDNSKGTCQPNKVDSSLHHVQFGLSDMLPDLCFCHFLELSNSTITEDNANTFKEDSRAYFHSTTCEIPSVDKLEVIYGDCNESAAENLAEVDSLNKLLSTSRNASINDSYEPIRMQNKEQITFSNIERFTIQHSFGHITERKDATLHDDTSNLCSSVEAKDMARIQQKDGHSTFKAESSEDAVRVQNKIENFTKPKTSAASINKMQNAQNKLDVGETVGSNKKDEAYNIPKVSSETPLREEKARRRRAESEKIYDWDSLRKEVYLKKLPEKRSSDTMDSLDWEAVRYADVSEISETIRERGMNNMLAERIKDFLNRLVREHESIDLEWLRDVPPDKSKDYLLSIRGLGLKSAECVRLLTLHHLAFPVDTNVGRICVRLGWVPLQPLPESLQLHLLELYPVLETIQKYLWPRLCKLDQRTLYELHYQMITFGKVFCTKSKPNCNACPMRGECRHFASAFASARLALPAPEDKSIVSSTYPIASENGNPPVFNQRSIPQLECSSFSQEMTVQKNCEPIIEEPATPEPECPETSESAIEDAFLEDPDEIPMIKLNFEKFTQNLQNYMQDNMDLQDGDLSKALVALNPEAASIPMPKLKNVSRLRTEHQVYEIPDSHPLLEGLDRREPDDPCPYLLAMWTPGETAQSTEPPEVCCNSQDTGQLCNRSACLACNCIRESQAHKVRGTLLIPCRTAMRGSFPLNGTYFQVNEVFADHDSSRNPIDVPRDWIWNLPRRMVCFGTSIPTIFRGLTTEGIQQCFWKGFVCVRGFDRVTRAPKPLYARLHFPASKAPKTRKGPVAAAAARADVQANNSSNLTGFQ